MASTGSISDVQEIMMAFAEETGLTSHLAPRRYLWTDAFAVCNLLELYRQTEDAQHQGLALRLVDQVHHVLGRHRADDPREGWISGLDEDEGEAHPTAGGLRIGKPLPERRPDQRYDQRLEWDRDGQYYHYLTKWMHALNRVSQVTGNPTYLRWAKEMAAAVHKAFTYEPTPGGPVRMVWKMSIDLSRPLVPSMGHHDPLDGYLTYNELAATAAASDGAETGPDLEDEIAEIAAICAGRNWVTDDALGLGGLLSDAYRAAQLVDKGQLETADLVVELLDASRQGLTRYMRRQPLEMPAAYRLAFRELGLAIGLQSVDPLRTLMEEDPSRFGAGIDPRLTDLVGYTALADAIERFWLQPAHQQSETWTDHADINRVMLATSLAPRTYLQV